MRSIDIQYHCFMSSPFLRMKRESECTETLQEAERASKFRIWFENHCVEAIRVISPLKVSFTVAPAELGENIDSQASSFCEPSEKEASLTSYRETFQG
jgi:hypothetical protein